MKGHVLFIHGWWASGWVWSRVAERFEAAGYTPHVLSLPGPASGRAGLSDHLDHATLAARAVGNPILVGHSVGGLIAMKMTERLAPPACIALTPAAPFGVLPRPSPILLRFALAALPSILLGRDFLPRALLRDIDLNVLERAEQDEVLAMMRPVAASQVRVVVPSLVRVDRRRMRAPLLVVGAAHDRLTPVAQTRAIARRYAADYLECPDAAHYLLRERGWSAMTDGVLGWLDDRLARRGPCSAPA